MTNPMALSDRERQLIAEAFNKEKDVAYMQRIARNGGWMNENEIKAAPWDELYARYQSISSPIIAKAESMSLVVRNYVREEEAK